MQFDEPLFHIHLNVDYPFNLTGILYFPKLTGDLQIQKDKIQLYQNPLNHPYFQVQIEEYYFLLIHFPYQAMVQILFHTKYFSVSLKDYIINNF